MGYEEEHKKWIKYKTFMSDYDYRHIQATIDKVCMYDENDKRHIMVKELLNEIKRLC